MAKDTFIRRKPHVNVAVIGNLQKMGLSFIGAHQVATGLAVSSQQDRDQLAMLLESGLSVFAAGTTTAKTVLDPIMITKELDTASPN